MDETINILLPYGYEPPTSEDIAKAKRWTLLRNENAARLSSLIEALMRDAATEMTRIGYRYNCKPEEFQFSEDKDLREEIAVLMDKLEEDILSLVEEYSLNETQDEERRSSLLPWLTALHSKGARNLAGTLHERLRQFMYDTEAQIAAMRMAGYGQAKAVSRVLSTMHAVYASPEMQAAFKKPSAAMYIQSHGVHYGNVGLSNSGAVNVENFGRQTATMAWMKSQLMEFDEKGAVGYYQLRGSTFPCAICDDEVGLHIGDILNDPYPHAHCMCYRVPIKPQDEEGYTTKKVYPNGARVVVMNGVETDKSDYKDLLTIARAFARQGEDVTIMERIHYKNPRYQEVFGRLMGTKYEKKCPDLLIGNKLYEYESYQRPWNERKVKNMLKDGLRQSPNIIIDNNGGMSDRKLRRNIMNRIVQGVKVDEVWLYEKGRVRKFFDNGAFLK